MKDKVLIDTNLIVYAYDKAETEKRKVCINLLQSIFYGEKEAYISNQILGEVFHIISKKIEKPISKEESQIIIESLIRSSNWTKIDYSTKEIQRAISLTIEYNIHFWDALIASTMILNNVYTIYTENEKDFKKIPGLKVINPLN